MRHVHFLDREPIADPGRQCQRRWQNQFHDDEEPERVAECRPRPVLEQQVEQENDPTTREACHIILPAKCIAEAPDWLSREMIVFIAETIERCHYFERACRWDRTSASNSLNSSSVSFSVFSRH